MHIPLPRWSFMSMFPGALRFADTGTQAAVMTPVQRSVLFRESGIADDATWDLIEHEHRVRAAGARILHLFGEVLSFDGEPVRDAEVEIRQSDSAGRYASGAVTLGSFRGIGRMRTDFEGRYQFRTILPVARTGRTAHIHARVVPPKGRVLETQLYLVDHPDNAADWHYQSLGPTQQAAVSLDPIERPDGDLDAGFNFVL